MSKLDGLQLINYNIGAAVDVSAPIEGAAVQVFANAQAGVDTATLTVDEWAKRKNSSLRLGAVTVGLSILDFALSLPIDQLDGKSIIETIGRQMAKSPTTFWTLWTAKMLAAGFVFSRIMPWARVASIQKIRLR